MYIGKYNNYSAEDVKSGYKQFNVVTLGIQLRSWIYLYGY